MGKVSSQTANSFTGGQIINPVGGTAGGHGALNSTAKSASTPGQVGPNIVIDIESENLTYNQARSIRLQL